MKVFINGDRGVLGRIAARAAKSALNGDEVLIFNAEKIVVSGSKKYLFNRYLERVHRGESVHGPFFPKTAQGIVKRAVRGMIPYKTGRGRQAFKRVKVFEGVPEKYSKQELESPGKTKEDFKDFTDRAVEYSKYYKEDKKYPVTVGNKCKYCEYKFDQNNPELKSGYVECWKEIEKDFNENIPHIFDIWNFI